MHDAVSSSVFPFPHSQVLIKTFHDAVATLEIVPSAASIYIFRHAYLIKLMQTFMTSNLYSHHINLTELTLVDVCGFKNVILIFIPISLDCFKFDKTFILSEIYQFYDCSISTSQADIASLQICIALEEVEVCIGLQKSFTNRISV